MKIDDSDVFELGCEVRVQGQWQWIAVAEAMRLGRSRIKRCPECNGQVQAYQAIEQGIIVHLVEHYERHSGCSLGDCFDGIRKPHPKVME